ncbi:MAG: hypothetical protein ACLQVJ_10185 [Syntrophobacteraceae bacterium]
MMWPHPLLMARIGESFSDMRNSDTIEEWAQYSWELEQQLESLSAQYRELAKNAGVLVDSIKAIEQERDQLFEKRNNLQKENDKLRKIIGDLRSRRRPS